MCEPISSRSDIVLLWHNDLKQSLCEQLQLFANSSSNIGNSSFIDTLELKP